MPDSNQPKSNPGVWTFMKTKILLEYSNSNQYGHILTAVGPLPSQTTQLAFSSDQKRKEPKSVAPVPGKYFIHKDRIPLQLLFTKSSWFLLYSKTSF